MDKNKHNSPWQYFERINETGKCKINNCGKVIKALGGSTSGLHTHLKSVHQVNLLKKGSCDDGNNNKNVTEICKKPCNDIRMYFDSTIDNTLAAIISRMVSKDALPFSIFCTSYDIRGLLQSKGDIPKSPNTIRKLVMEYGKKIQEKTIKELQLHKQKGHKFSLSLDEWSSSRNRRYINVNVHKTPTVWNLGLARIYGSMPAEKCLEILNSKLAAFKLNLDDIVATTTDGASVMKKFGRLSGIGHQMCYAHAIQLAVLHVLYKNNYSYDFREENFLSTHTHTLQNNENDVNEEENEGEEVFNEGMIITGEEFEGIDLSTLELRHADAIHPLIEKIRKVVKIFRKSPTKNDALQQYVKLQCGKELSLILDSKTRWNSLLDMLQRFRELGDSVRKTVIDLEVDFDFSQNDMKLLNEIISALQPVKIAVEALCCNDATLLTSDITFRFILDELSKHGSTLSSSLKESLVQQIKARRTIFSDILNFLHNPNGEEQVASCDIFHPTSKQTITKHILDLTETLFLEKKDSDKNDDDNVNDVQIIDSVDFPSKSNASGAADATKLSMKEKLYLMINQKLSSKAAIGCSTKETINFSQNIKDIIRNELILYSEQNVRGKYLEIFYQSLLTIPPTSVAAERAFSSAGLFCTKIRSRLNDSTLDMLCFLRAYFLAQNSNHE